MKKLLIIFSLAILTGLASAQTGAGWASLRTKVSFLDSTYFYKGIMLNGATSGHIFIRGYDIGEGVIVIPSSGSIDTLTTEARLREYGGEGGAMIYPRAGIAVSTGTSWGASVTNNSANWNTAYSDRLKWDGGATGLNAATGRTSLGATTVGSNLFTLPNPSNIYFLQINADNTVSALSSTLFKTSLGLNYVTNESKLSMFDNPTFTYNVTMPSFTLGATAVTTNGTELNYLDGVTGTTGTGNIVLSASPIITGHPTIEGVTSTGGTGTGNLVFSASPSFSGTIGMAAESILNWDSGNTTITHAADELTVDVNDFILSGNLTLDGAIVNPSFALETKVTDGDDDVLDVDDAYYQIYTGKVAQNVIMPDVTTLVLGRSYMIYNDNSVGAITVKSSGGNTIVILAAGTKARLVCKAITGETETSWSFYYDAVFIDSARRLYVENSLTLAGTNGTTMTFPSTSATIARTDAGNTFTGHNIFEGVTATGATGTGNMVFATSPTFSTSIVMGDANLNEAELEILDGATLSTTELNYVDGVTNAIQDQIDAKVPYTGATTTADLGSESLLTTGDIGEDESRINHIYTDDATVTNPLRANMRFDSLTFEAGDVINPMNYRMYFKIDSTANAPAVDDSIFTDPRFIDMDIKVWRTDATDVEGGLERQYLQNWSDDVPTYGYEFDSETGEVMFHPKFVAKDRVIIEVVNSALWTSITPQVSYCAAYQAVYDAMTYKPSEAVATAQNAMVYSLDTCDYWDGVNAVWDRMDLFLVFATEINTGNEALIWWNNPAQYADNVSSTAWTTLQGYTGDGSADYISSNYNPSTDAVHYALDDATIGIYLRINKQEDTQTAFGAYVSPNRTSLLLRDNSDDAYARLNQASGTVMSGSNTNSSGLFILTRTASNAIELYRNGVSLLTDTDVSTSIPNAELYILATSGLGFLSTNQVAIFFVMDGIAHDNEATAINTIIETYMDAIGTGVE